jgi:hypothetical protein
MHTFICSKGPIIIVIIMQIKVDLIESGVRPLMMKMTKSATFSNAFGYMMVEIIGHVELTPSVDVNSCPASRPGPLVNLSRDLSLVAASNLVMHVVCASCCPGFFINVDSVKSHEKAAAVK